MKELSLIEFFCTTTGLNVVFTALRNITTIALCGGSVRVTFMDADRHTHKHTYINPYSSYIYIYPYICSMYTHTHTHTHTQNLVLQKTSVTDCGLTCFHEALSSFIITICHFCRVHWINYRILNSSFQTNHKQNYYLVRVFYE